MKAFKNVLLLQPLNKQTIARATSLLQSNQSKLTLFDVVPEIGGSEVTSLSGKKIDLQRLLVQDHHEELKQLSESLQAQGLRTRCHVKTGSAFLEVIRQVIKENHDLMIMTADGSGSIRERLFGTTSLHLMRKCPCPVWVIKPTRRRKVRKVLAAVDPDPGNETRQQLNVAILHRAIAIASSDNSELHVIHVWNTLGGEVDRGRRWMTKTEIRLYVEQTAGEHRRRLNDLLEKHVKHDVQVHMIQGRPGNVIPEIVDRDGIDLLVMGTVCRTGIPGFFIGNTAEMVLGQVDCSVLTIKPDDFVTPVKL